MSVGVAASSRPSESATATCCRSCGVRGLEVFYEVPSVPVHNSLLLPTRDQAVEFPVGDLELGFCSTCGFIQNLAFSPGRLRYGPGYEDSQANSPRFRAYADELGRSLLERYAADDPILEIGCGKGDFLRLVCDLSGRPGIGYDPALDVDLDGDDLIRWVKEPFDSQVDESAGLVICRHTLEHIQDVAGFADALVRFVSRRGDAVAYVEVPDTSRILRECAFWDLYYEHCSYFTEATLVDLFARSGARIERAHVGFDDQYLQLELKGGEGPSVRRLPSTDLGDEVRGFADDVEQIRRSWEDRLADWADRGARVVLWGAGSKAVGFLTAVGASTVDVAEVVDINPKKHGRFLPGTGHEVVAPASLTTTAPDVVVVLNPIYRDEIRSDLHGRGLRPEVVSL